MAADMKKVKIHIEEQYAKEAKRIIQEHQNLLSKMTLIENELAETKNVIESYKRDLEELRAQTGPEMFKDQALRETMIQYEQQINKIQNNLKPYLKKLEDLKKSSHVLYGILKEKWPGSTDEDLKEALHLAMDNLKS